MTSGRGNLAISENAKKKMGAITRKLREEQRVLIQVNELHAKEQETENRRMERRRSRYIRIARKGFPMLAAFARSATMRKFFRITTGPFVFFSHHDDAFIYLFSDRMQIRFYFGVYLSDENFIFPYASPEKFNEWVCDSPEKFDEWKYTYEHHDSDDICSETSYHPVSRAFRKRSEANFLDLQDAILSVLVDCADPRRFEELLSVALINARENR